MKPEDTWRKLATQLTNRLRDAVARVTLEEFREQEAIFDQTSRWGREVLYLASNIEWNRRTREVLGFAAADSLETMIRVDVDFSRITHEAFRHRREPVWLPLLMLAPPRPVEAGDPDGSPAPADPPAYPPDETATVVPTPLVRDAAGADVPVVPQSEARRWVAAALADIVLDMAPGPVAPRAAPSREQRLLFSAALYRVLREANDVAPSSGPGAAPGPDLTSGTGRLEHARTHAQPVLRGIETVLASDDIGPGQASERAELLIRRAARILHALSVPTTIVVIGVSPEPIATTFSVTLAPRPLKVRHPEYRSTSRTQVRIDLTLADPDADRVVEAQLPDGLSYSPVRAVDAEVQLHQPPRSLRHITELMQEISQRTAAKAVDPQPDPAHDPVLHCLADFTAARIDVARDTYRFHRATADAALGAPLVEDVPVWLDRLRDQLRAVTAAPENTAGWAAVLATWKEHLDRSTDVQDLEHVHQITRSGPWPPIFRVLEAGRSGPRTAYARFPAVENRAVRASPGRAELRLLVEAADSSQLDAARYSGLMSLFVLGAVLVFLPLFRHQVENDVLATTLTLFAVIQAGRVEHPDRSSLRGALAAGTWWVRIAPVLPTVLFAIALGFVHHPSTWWLALTAAAVQLLLQLVLQLTLQTVRPRWMTRLAGRVPVRARRLVPGRVKRLLRPPLTLLETDPARAPDHERVDVMRSSWWRSTTAGALLLGRPAHAYVVEHDRTDTGSGSAGPGGPGGAENGGREVSLADAARSSLARVLGTIFEPPERPERRSTDLNDTPANILAFLRAGTFTRSLTFFVFREYPQNWPELADAVKVDLDVDRLIAHEEPLGMVDIYLGQEIGRFQAVGDHPVTRVMTALRKRHSLVLDCQLPCLPPKGGSRTRGWSRVQVGLRSDEVASLDQLLDDVAEAVRTCGGPEVDLLVDISTQTPPRRFQGRLIDPGARSDLTPEELDVVRQRPATAEPGQWVEIAVCGYTQAGVVDILSEFREAHPGLQLAGLTTALLYGTRVIFMLGHQPASAGTRIERVRAPQGLGADGAHPGPAAANGRDGLVVAAGEPMSLEHGELILVEPLTPAQLAPADHGGRLLRVHARSSDRPGTLSLLADRLTYALARVARIDPATAPVPHIWYGQTEVAYGRLATTRILMSLPGEYDSVHGGADLGRVEREVQQAMSAGPPDPSRLVGEGGREENRVLVSLSFAQAAGAAPATLVLPPGTAPPASASPAAALRGSRVRPD